MPLRLTMYHGGVEEWLYAFLTLALMEVVTFPPRQLYPKGQTPSTHWIEYWMVSKVDLITLW